MYAVFKSGGKQYRVTEGQTVRLEKLNIKTGQFIEFEQVLILSDNDKTKIGTPIIEDVKVQAEVVSHGRHDKIKIIKFRRRKHSLKQNGHRQWFTDVKIFSITQEC
ncbi:50S ribosomal protein L21 [Candidatus Hartigia pinicola]|nr:50S ribosomal protein L21 [Candidatus Hartigia pinicola]